jgi:ATP-binding cassette subfamily B protein
MTQGLIPVAVVFMTRLFVDGLVAALGAGGSWDKLQPAFLSAVLLALLLLLNEFLQSAAEWVRTAQSEQIQDHVMGLVHDKSMAVDLGFYESPDYYDRLHRVVSEAIGHPLTLIQSAGGLLQSALTLLGMLVVVIPYGVWLPAALVLSALPALVVVYHFNRRYHNWWAATTTDRRWTQYYNVMLTNANAAAELRLFELGPFFQSAYQRLRHDLRRDRLRLLRDQSLARLAAGSAGMVIAGATLAWYVWQALQRTVTLGDLTLLYQAFNNAQSVMRALLGNLGQIYGSTLFLGNLFEFLDLQPQIADPAHPVEAPQEIVQGIRFRHITFRYPGSSRTVFQDFDLTIPARRVVAIVGANGAGKSTLVKLLCRFYEPEAGCIEVDGVNIRDLPLVELRRLMSVLFQLPVPYHATVSQNIAIADYKAKPDQNQVETASRHAGAHEFVERLPQAYDTLLGKWFGAGTELSAGEWQRVALARAYIRRGQILVLDEPTSFIDSWAEVDWYERFRELAQKRTAIIITHRFSIAMRTDMIFVMHEGQIVESGTHAQLLALDGRYAASWEAQMKAQPVYTG